MALQKLRKLRETIRQLPATGQRQELVEAVKEHPVVLVAGANRIQLVLTGRGSVYDGVIELNQKTQGGVFFFPLPRFHL